ncbi:CPBP family intramembrane glutamic endopeptidase [Brevibacillus sp. TJ4]|uniref:CPBP family intramembrane glutamic endopeptidase n=1 Tax=Brevibacillus sp. TJ4 TaxID=3234853 RepID=UPI0037CFEF5D
MSRNRSLLLLLVYGMVATLAIFYGLVERQSLFVTFVAFHLLVCLGIPLLHGWREGKLAAHWRAAWGVYDTRGARFGLILGLIQMVGVMSGIWLLLRTEGRAEEIRAILQNWGLHGGWLGLFALYLIIVNSLLEELMWRGFVLQRLQQVMSRPAAIMLSSLFFSLYHFIIVSVLFNPLWGVFLTALVFGAGVLWAWMKSMFPSVYPTWFSHMLVDVGIAASVVWWIYR